MTFYAQNQEDVILWQALQNIQNGFYVDVGAGHPTDISVTKIFYDRGWHGINIEPQAEMCKLLEQQRPRDINLCACAGPKSGSETFMYYDGGVGIVANKPEIRDIFEHHGHKGHEALLGQASLTDILDEHPPPAGRIHFLKIDVEGYEGDVLQGLDLKRYRPWIILAEAILPTTLYRTNQRWTPYLLDNHYRFVYFDGQNCYFLAAERVAYIRTTWNLE